MQPQSNSLLSEPPTYSLTSRHRIIPSTQYPSEEHRAHYHRITQESMRAYSYTIAIHYRPLAPCRIERAQRAVPLDGQDKSLSPIAKENQRARRSALLSALACTAYIQDGTVGNSNCVAVFQSKAPRTTWDSNKWHQFFDLVPLAVYVRKQTTIWSKISSGFRYEQWSWEQQFRGAACKPSQAGSPRTVTW